MTLEAFLARVRTDAALRAALLARPADVALDAGLSESVVRDLVRIDWAAVEAEAAGVAHAAPATGAESPR